MLKFATSLALIFAFCGPGLAQYGDWVSIDSLNAMAVGGDSTSLITTLDKTLVIDDENYQKSIISDLQATGVNSVGLQSSSSLTIQDGDTVRTEASEVYQTWDLPGEFSVVMSQGHDLSGDSNPDLTSVMTILGPDGEEIFSIFGFNYSTDVDMVIEQALKDAGFGINLDQIRGLQKVTTGGGFEGSASKDGMTYTWGSETNTMMEIEV